AACKVLREMIAILAMVRKLILFLPSLCYCRIPGQSAYHGGGFYAGGVAKRNLALNRRHTSRYNGGFRCFVAVKPTPVRDAPRWAALPRHPIALKAPSPR